MTALKNRDRTCGMPRHRRGQTRRDRACVGGESGEPGDEQRESIGRTRLGEGGLVSYLTVGGAMKAAEFYVHAFGAEIVTTMPVDDQGRTMHVHLHVNRASLTRGTRFPSTAIRSSHPSPCPDADR